MSQTERHAEALVAAPVAVSGFFVQYACVATTVMEVHDGGLAVVVFEFVLDVAFDAVLDTVLVVLTLMTDEAGEGLPVALAVEVVGQLPETKYAVLPLQDDVPPQDGPPQ